MKVLIQTVQDSEKWKNVLKNVLLVSQVAKEMTVLVLYVKHSI